MRLKQLIWILAVLPILAACSGKRNGKARTDWRVSMNHGDKKPYGTYLAVQLLPHYFPGVRTEQLSRWYRYTNISKPMQQNSPSLLVLCGLDFQVSDDELSRLVSFAEAGNEVFILSSRLDNKLEDYLGFKKTADGQEEFPLTNTNTGKDNLDILRRGDDSTRRYGYEGRSLKGYFDIERIQTVAEGLPEAQEAQDTADLDEGFALEETGDTVTYIDPEVYGENYSEGPVLSGPEILGRNGAGPNFIRYGVGSGHITLHAAPLIMSNYFLLQGNNREYLTYVWATFPQDLQKIYWHDYYRHTVQGSGLGVIMRYNSTRWALLLTALALLLFLLFETRRRYRVIPLVAPLENTSVSFVETVGRLYYNKGNHLNLAEKMVQHFLEFVRSHYFLNTNVMDDHFVHQLSVKSGLSESTVRGTLQLVHEVRLRSVLVDEVYLYHLYNSFQNFYKKHS